MGPGPQPIRPTSQQPICRRAGTNQHESKDSHLHDSSARAAAPSWPPSPLNSVSPKNDLRHGFGPCSIVPASVQSALDFAVDMVHLIMPSSFLANLSDECPISAAILDSTGARNYIRACKGLACATATSSPPHSHDLGHEESAEPGDTFGFDSNTPAACACDCACSCCENNCCFASSAATVRSWQRMAWNASSVGVQSMHLSTPRSLANCASGVAGEPVAARRHCVRGDEPTVLDLGLPKGEGHDSLPPYSTFGKHYSAEGEVKPDSSGVPSSFRPHPHLDSSSSSVSDSDEPSAPTLAEFASADFRLLEANQYLQRRIRKLELTNQIIKEAYAEVQEMLQAERQSKAMQLNTLERKHEEDMEKLVQEYQDRADRCRDGGEDSLDEFGSDSEKDSAYMFRPRFTAVSASVTSRMHGPKERRKSASNDSSPQMRSAVSGRVSPLSLRRAVSDVAFVTRPADDDEESFLPFELTVGFTDTTVDASIAKDEEDDSDAQSDASWETNDDERESSAAGCPRIDYDGIEFGSRYSRVEGVELSDEDLGDDADTESDDCSSTDDDEEDDDEDGTSYRYGAFSDDGYSDTEQNADGDTHAAEEHLPIQRLTEQSAGNSVDPAQAVISRYYAQTGTLSIAADIDDIPTEGYEGSTAAHSDDDGIWHSTTVENSSALSCDNNGHGAIEAHDIWEALRGGAATDSNGLLAVAHGKSTEEREMERISLLPADHRIAKFVCRASSHLQQGARSGLSLGFMMHNLEALSVQYTSNHRSILCAFVECLYQLVEAATVAVPSAPNGGDSLPEAKLLPSALAKRVRSEMRSPLQAVARIAKLLHTFITLPGDQETVLRQLEQLSEANCETRLAKHALLLRILYDSELIDKTSIMQWYSTAESGGAGERGQLLRLKAAPLLIELSSSAAASSVAAAIDEIHQQIVTARAGQGGAGTASASAPSTPSLAGLVAAARCCTGSLTPVSDENATMHSQSSDCEGAGSKCATRDARQCHTTSILGIERKTNNSRGSLVGSDTAQHTPGDVGGIGGLRPTKQVTFAAS